MLNWWGIPATIINFITNYFECITKQVRPSSTPLHFNSPTSQPSSLSSQWTSLINLKAQLRLVLHPIRCSSKSLSCSAHQIRMNKRLKLLRLIWENQTKETSHLSKSKPRNQQERKKPTHQMSHLKIKMSSKLCRSHRKGNVLAQIWALMLQ